MHLNEEKGFTLLELLVVVLIIGILAAIALPMYNRAIERMRIAEVDSIFGSSVGAQERFFLQNARYTPNWHQLDSVPLSVRKKTANNPYSNPENTVYYTNGSALMSDSERKDVRPGYIMYFQKKTDLVWHVIAERIGWGKYNYVLIKEFDFQTGPKKTICIPGTYRDDKRICMDYMGIDDEAAIPADPRV